MSHSRFGSALILALTSTVLLSCSSKPVKSPEEVLAQRFKFFDAIQKGDTKLVKAFIENGVDANTKDDAADTALVLAADRGETEMARMLIDAGADVNARGNGGRTALMAASFDESKQGFARTDTVRMLIKARANVNAKDDVGLTALIRAAQTNVHSIATLTGNGGKVQVMKIDSNGEIVRMLIEAKADVNAMSNDGRTASNVASTKGHTEIIRMLREAGAN